MQRLESFEIPVEKIELLRDNDFALEKNVVCMKKLVVDLLQRIGCDDRIRSIDGTVLITRCFCRMCLGRV